MPSKSSSAADRLDSQDLPSENARSILSLFAIVHLFLVFVGVTCIIRPPSPLHLRLLGFAAPYIQSLNFDLDYTPYYLTMYVDPGEEDFANVMDASAGSRIEILPAGKDPAVDSEWVMYPDGGFHGGERYRRHLRLAKQVTDNAEDETLPSLIASGVATNFYHETGVEPFKIRCRHHRLQRRAWVTEGTAEQRDPSSPLYFVTVFQATCAIGDDGVVEVVPDVAVGQAAPVVDLPRPEAIDGGPANESLHRDPTNHSNES